MIKIVSDPNSSVVYDGMKDELNAKHYHQVPQQKKAIENKGKEDLKKTLSEKPAEILSLEDLDDEVRDWNVEYLDVVSQEENDIDVKKEKKELLQKRKSLSKNMFASFVDVNKKLGNEKSTKKKVKDILTYMDDKERKKILSKVTGIKIRDAQDELKAQNKLDDRKTFEAYSRSINRHEKLYSENTEKARLYNIIKRAYQNKLVLHGQQQGKIKSTDIDGQACEKLLKLADFFITKNPETGKNKRVSINRTYVANGEEGESGLHVDTGGAKDGVEIKDTEKVLDDGTILNTLFGSKLVIDEHENQNTSSTKILYELLKELKVFPAKEMKIIEKFVQFVDVIDSHYYDIAGMDYDASHKTLAGLYRKLPIDFIWKYFREDSTRTGFEILDDDYLKNNKIMASHWDHKNNKQINKPVRLQWVSNKQKEANDESKKEINILNQGGKFLRKGDQQFIVDMGGTLTNGPQVSSYYEYNFLRIYPDGQLYMYAKDGLPSQMMGKKVGDENFFIYKLENKKELEKFLDEFNYDPLGVEGKETTSFMKDVVLNQYTIMQEMKEKNIQFKKTKIPYMSEKGNIAYGKLISFGADKAGDQVIFETKERGKPQWRSALKWDTFISGMQKAEQYIQENPTPQVQMNTKVGTKKDQEQQVS